jgi:hypothetical protein
VGIIHNILLFRFAGPTVASRNRSGNLDGRLARMSANIAFLWLARWILPVPVPVPVASVGARIVAEHRNAASEQRCACGDVEMDFPQELQTCSIEASDLLQSAAFQQGQSA